MHIPATTAGLPPKTPQLSQFVQRLAARITGSAPADADVPDSPATLTPGLLRATLIEMGAGTDPQALALAEAFARLGLPLTRDTLASASAALAQAPDASPRAYALARAWELPTTPAALNALTAAIQESAIAPHKALSPELLSWLGLAADADAEPDLLAAHLFLMAQGFGRSTEHRLTTDTHRSSLQNIQDARSTLLRLAQGSADRSIRHGADALAAHIEGQQLINQAARQHGEADTFYLAVPLLISGEPSLAEMRLGVWDDEQDAADLAPETPWLRAVVRLATTRLGRVQVELRGTLAGMITCRLGAERSSAVRLFQRHTAQLVASLEETGDWQVDRVECFLLAAWPPLWHGGDTLNGPRTCIDWRA